MKKTFLLALAATAFSVSAQGVTVRQAPVENPTPRTASEVSMDFCYCDGMGIAPDLVAAGTECSGAMYIPAETAARFKGACVTSVSVFTGYDYETTTNIIPEANVWISYDLSEAPIRSTTGKLSSEMLTYNDIKLDEPYEIEGDKGFYVGFTVVSPGETQSPIIWDHMKQENNYGGWTKIGANSQWVNLADTYGAVLIKARMEGDNLPIYNVGVYSTTCYGFAYPGNEVESTINFINYGASTIENVGLEVTIGDSEPIKATAQVEGDIKYNDLFRLYINSAVNQIGNNVPVRIKLTEVNGHPNECADNEAVNYVLCLPKGEGFARNVVMEQSTALTYGFSPRGIVSFELLGKDYGTTKSFLPVMVHMYDDLSCEGYDPFFTSLLSSKLPSVIPNRLREYRNSPVDYDSMDFIYTKVSQMPAFADLEVKVATDENDESILDITTNTSFLDDCEGDWRLAYVVRRDNVGPYPQANDFANDAYGEMGGFEVEPEIADIMHNNVGAVIETYDGIEGSVPANVKKGETYEHNYKLILSDASYNKNSTILVYLINHYNGVIENAKAVPYSEWIKAGVSSVSDQDVAELTTLQGGVRVEGLFENAQIFTVDGSLIASLSSSGIVKLTPGIYVVIIDGKPHKVRIR